jgi:tRNA dimethylallyltransferase
MKNDKILILGVTASGKSRLGFDLAKKRGAEIVCVDSMKVYRRMDIGTAKPPLEARKEVKYHLIDVVEPSEAYSVGTYLDQANEAIEQIRGGGKGVIAVGGTAMYIKALLFGLFEGPGSDERIRQKLRDRAEGEGPQKLYSELQQIDSEAAERIHPNDSKRIIRALEVYELTGKPISSFQQQWDQGREPGGDWTIIGVRREKEVESQRINKRVKKMIELGLVEEVKGLLAEAKLLSKQAKCAIGYAEIIDHLEGKISLEEAIEAIKINTRRLAKHQRTWFKTFRNVNWLELVAEASRDEILEAAEKLLN